jgi:hypothetical protein
MPFDFDIKKMRGNIWEDKQIQRNFALCLTLL